MGYKKLGAFYIYGIWHSKNIKTRDMRICLVQSERYVELFIYVLAIAPDETTRFIVLLVLNRSCTLTHTHTPTRPILGEEHRNQT